MKSNYVLRWVGKPARDYFKSLPDSKFKYKGASADAMLEALEKNTKPKSNKIAVFTKLCTLKQGEIVRVHKRDQETGRVLQLPK